MSGPVTGRPVFLTGMMGSGKSTVGRLLALEIGGPFVDLDQRIETMFGDSIAALFAQGEDRFRRCEALALRSLIAEPGFTRRPSVVATGGGVVLDEGNRVMMLEAGTVAFLEVPLDELVSRLQGDDQRAKRPLVAEAGTGLRGRIAQLMAARRHAYLDATLVVDASHRPSVVVEHLVDALDPEGRRGTRVG